MRLTLCIINGFDALPYTTLACNKMLLFALSVVSSSISPSGTYLLSSFFLEPFSSNKIYVMARILRTPKTEFCQDWKWHLSWDKSHVCCLLDVQLSPCYSFIPALPAITARPTDTFYRKTKYIWKQRKSNTTVLFQPSRWDLKFPI